MILKGRIQEKIKDIVKLDVKDKKILYFLTQDSRMPLSKIAKSVMLSRDSVNYRIKRLQENGVILGLFPLLNYKHFGFHIFHVFIIFDEYNKKEYESILKDLNSHPNVINLIEYTDRWDFQITLLAKGIKDYDRIMTDITSKHPNIIVEKDILEVIKTYKMSFIPYDMDIRSKIREIIPGNKLKLDEKDLEILRALSKGARQSTYEIGSIVGLNPDTVSYRIKKMVDNGVIKNFTSLNNFTYMGYHWYTFSIQMKTFDHKHELRFIRFIKDNPNIIRAAKTLGVWDIILYIVVDNTKEFHKIIKDIKREFYGIIKHYETWVSYEEHFYNPIPNILYDKI